MSKFAELKVVIDDSAAKEALATHLEELAENGETLTPDDLREAAARLRVEATSA